MLEHVLLPGEKSSNDKLHSGPLGLLLTGVGFIDSLIDLRARLARRRENSGGPD